MKRLSRSEAKGTQKPWYRKPDPKCQTFTPKLKVKNDSFAVIMERT